MSGDLARRLARIEAEEGPPRRMLHLWQAYGETPGDAVARHYGAAGRPEADAVTLYRWADHAAISATMHRSHAP